MASTIIAEHGTHRNVLLEDFGHGEMVQANQHLIIHDGHAMILDPGGHKGGLILLIVQAHRVIGKRLHADNLDAGDIGDRLVIIAPAAIIIAGPAARLGRQTRRRSEPLRYRRRLDRKPVPRAVPGTV